MYRIKKNTKFTLILLLITLLSGCDLFDYHPYDGDVKGETGINKKNIARIEEACAGKKTIRFAFVSDTQGFYSDTNDFVKHLNTQSDIDFLIHGGDISDFGLTNEFMWMRDILNKLIVPYVVLIGNHDCLANGEDVFRTVFGELNFSFLAGNAKFICLNTNALEYDYSRPIPDFAFLETQFNDQSAEYEKTVFAMHVAPFSEQFNNNVAYIFHRYINEFPNLQFCLYGHGHQLSADDLFGDGLIYYQTPTVKKRKYLVFTLKPNNEYEYEVVEF